MNCSQWAWQMNGICLAVQAEGLADAKLPRDRREGRDMVGV